MSLNLLWIIPAVAVGTYIFLDALMILLGSVLLSSPVRDFEADLEKIMLKHLTKENSRWIIQNSMAPRGSFAWANIKLHVFAVPDNQTELLVVQSPQKTALEFDTRLAKDYRLTTANSADEEQIPPTLGTYRQTMTVKSLEELYKYHEEALAFLAKQKDLHPIPVGPPEEKIEDLRKHIGKLKEVFFNPRTMVLLPYLLLTKYKRANRTIADQFADRSAS